VDAINPLSLLNGWMWVVDKLFNRWQAENFLTDFNHSLAFLGNLIENNCSSTANTIFSDWQLKFCQSFGT
jgi:hypothetical protein